MYSECVCVGTVNVRKGACVCSKCEGRTCAFDTGFLLLQELNGHPAQSRKYSTSH